MRITINAEEKELRDGMTIKQLLEELKIPHGAVVCELNFEIVPKKSYAESVLKDGDRMEIVKFVGGGIMGKGIYLGVIMIFLSIASAFAQSWEEVTGTIKDVDLQTIAVLSDNSDIIYVGSSKNLYKSIDNGRSWEQVLSVRGTRKAVNFITVSDHNPNTVYVGTQNGLYQTEDAGLHWKMFPTGIGDAQREITAIAIDPADSQRIYIGTLSGLMWSSDNGKIWQKDIGEFSDVEITFILISPNNSEIIYVATAKGLYKSIDKGISWSRVFVTSQASEINSESSEKIKAIAIDKSAPQSLYLATENGAYISENGGISWQRIAETGLVSSYFQHILYSPERKILFAATTRGVFKFLEEEERWIEIYSGLRERDCRFLGFNEEKNLLWVVTKSGVFKISIGGAEKKERWNEKEILDRFSNEPTVQHIQSAAVDYAEVHPDKIRNWRKGAAMRAWMPTLSAGLDSDRNIVSNSGNTATPRIFFEDGPDEIGWDIGLSWDFGDLVWNPSQTSIDTRSKLMVELRDDILDEVTRLYFSRRALQIELFLNPPAEMQKRIEKELRLQELTANIDALTGGYLSQNLE